MLWILMLVNISLKNMRRQVLKQTDQEINEIDKQIDAEMEAEESYKILLNWQQWKQVLILLLLNLQQR